MLSPDHHYVVSREGLVTYLRRIGSAMTTRSTPAPRTSKVWGLTSALSRAWESARLADRQVMEIRTDLSRQAIRAL